MGKTWLKIQIGFFALLFLIFMLFLVSGGEDNSSFSSGGGEPFNGSFTDDLPTFPEIKGKGQISDEIAQYAVGTAVKYQLLPSVILSQYAYESMWGKSQSAKNDTNFFGITWFSGSPFPQGSARGIGGSEGGYYMKFPNPKASFNYYGFMVASQSNFNASVGLKNPSESLLILGRGGYAAAGITENSPYHSTAMNFIQENNWQEYDNFAISKWNTLKPSTNLPSKGDITVLNSVLGQTVENGQCYGLTAFYVQKMGGPQLMGSGKSYAMLIGEDYDWQAYGWQVILHPKPSDLKAGDVVNWQAGGRLSPGIYGHTGIISAVSDNGQTFSTYEQNAEQGQICAQYQRTFELTEIRSIVRKVK